MGLKVRELLARWDVELEALTVAIREAPTNTRHLELVTMFNTLQRCRVELDEATWD